MTTYKCYRDAERCDVKANGIPLDVRYHIVEPVNGFEWGNDGAGAEALAFTILCHHGDRDMAEIIYHHFVSEILSKLTIDTWHISDTEIQGFIEYVGRRECQELPSKKPVPTITFSVKPKFLDDVNRYFAPRVGVEEYI